MKNPQLDLIKQLRRKGYTNHEIVRYLLDKIEKEGKHKNLSNRIKK